MRKTLHLFIVLILSLGFITSSAGAQVLSYREQQQLNTREQYGETNLILATEPDIQVDPSFITARQLPEEVTTQILTIANQGNIDLTWSIAEQPLTRIFAGSMPFIPAKISQNGTSNNPKLTVTSPAGVLRKPESPANPQAVLWDQPLSLDNQNGYVNQEFGDAPTYSSYLADDFINVEMWKINTIFVPGNFFTGGTSFSHAGVLHWQIYADAGGIPAGNPSGGGAVPVWNLSLTPSNVQIVYSLGSNGFDSNVTLNLKTPLNIPAGHWWLVFYPTMDMSVGGQYGRQPADTTNDFIGKFINPGGGYGKGTAWQNWTIWDTKNKTDIAFRLEGQVVSPTDIPWLSESPITGTLKADTSIDITLSLNSSGLIFGTYHGNLLVNSNDPDTPQVVVPITLTITLDLPDIHVVPNFLAANQLPNKITTQIFTIDNQGTDELTWSLVEQPLARAFAGSMPFVPVHVGNKNTSGNPLITISSPARGLRTPEVIAITHTVLWNQPLSAVDQLPYMNQEFSDSPEMSSFLADDFINSEPWNINTIFVPGDFFNGGSSFTNSAALHWQIYADAGGVPAGDPSGAGLDPVWNYRLNPSDAQIVYSLGTGGYKSNVSLNLATPLGLPAGHWWLVFYPTMNFDKYGQYGRQSSDSTNGFTGQFINPGGGWGKGTEWLDWEVIGAPLTDIAFRLEGDMAQPSDIPWLSESPITGTLPAGTSIDITVTFNSTGLWFGMFQGDLLVTSNDPDTPMVTVPVRLSLNRVCLPLIIK